MPTSLRRYAEWAPSRLALHLAVCAALATSAAGQTRFQWPDTTIDVGKYPTVDQCNAAAERIAAGQYALRNEAAWRDTMPFDMQENLRPLAAPVIQAATRCSAKFDQRTAKLADFAPLLQLYLYANRDADAKVLYDRRLAAITAKDSRQRVAVEDSAVLIYLHAQPRRLELAEQVLLTRARGGADRLDRMALYYRLMDAGNEAGDTVRAKRAAEWVIGVADSLTQEERETEKFTKMGPMGGDVVVFGAMQTIVGVKTLVDSLRHSTMAMVNLERGMWTKFTKERVDAFPLPIGQHAPNVAGDFWFPREAAGEKHPAPGHVSVVEFTDATGLYGGCLGIGSWGVVTDACVFPNSSLRRLSDRFPGIDVTFVVGTRGNFLQSLPTSPAEEAEFYHNWVEPFHIKGAVMSVTTRPFWNLPDPDGRRVDKLTPNATAYGFGKSWQVEGGGFGGKYLVDQDGIIVDVIFNEPATFQFVDALVHRQQAGGDRAEK